MKTPKGHPPKGLAGSRKIGRLAAKRPQDQPDPCSRCRSNENKFKRVFFYRAWRITAPPASILLMLCRIDPSGAWPRARDPDARVQRANFWWLNRNQKVEAWRHLLASAVFFLFLQPSFGGLLAKPAFGAGCALLRDPGRARFLGLAHSCVQQPDEMLERSKKRKRRSELERRIRNTKSTKPASRISEKRVSRLEREA